MKLNLKRILCLALPVLVVGVPVIAGTSPNCYTPKLGTCWSNVACLPSTTLVHYGKQLNYPGEQGCCEYDKLFTTWSSWLGGSCPCDDGLVHVDISGANFNPLKRCYMTYPTTGYTADFVEAQGSCQF